MKEVGRYRVVGQRAYRGHQPGEEFEACLDRDAETRAVNRGSITVLERLTADIKPGSFVLPVERV